MATIHEISARIGRVTGQGSVCRNFPAPVISDVVRRNIAPRLAVEAHQCGHEPLAPASSAAEQLATRAGRRFCYRRNRDNRCDLPMSEWLRMIEHADELGFEVARCSFLVPRRPCGAVLPLPAASEGTKYRAVSLNFSGRATRH